MVGGKVLAARVVTGAAWATVATAALWVAYGCGDVATSALGSFFGR